MKIFIAWVVTVLLFLLVETRVQHAAKRNDTFVPDSVRFWIVIQSCIGFMMGGILYREYL